MAKSKHKNLLSLPNELIIEILLYCSGRDVVNVAEAHSSSKLWEVIASPRLWRTAVIGPPGDAKKYLKYLGSHTSSLTVVGVSKTNKKAGPGSKQSSLTESLINSVRLRCTRLSHFTLDNCIFDANVIRFSLFPKTISHLKLIRITMTNLALVRNSVRSSPFYCIKKSLPRLGVLELRDTEYDPSDSLALVSGCEESPSLDIAGPAHTYTFPAPGDTGQRLTRDARRNTNKLFKDLIEYHYVKKSYNTRRTKPV